LKEPEIEVVLLANVDFAAAPRPGQHDARPFAEGEIGGEMIEVRS
jgi:hypothetical protein